MPSTRLGNDGNADVTKYTKRVADHLCVSVSYHTLKHKDAFDVEIEFQNTLDSRMLVNPAQTAPANSTGELSWLKSVLRLGLAPDPSYDPITSKGNEPVKVFLGYLQLLGYVVLNYRLGPALGLSASDVSGDGSQWWGNPEYWKQYGDANDDSESDTEELLGHVPFIRNGDTSPLVVGGRLGGIADLPAETSQQKALLASDEYTKYFLHDIPFLFGTAKFPQNLGHTHYTNLVKELSHTLIPFYCTPQTLMFTDLTIAPCSTETLRFSLPTPPQSLPPSYNTRLTGLSCDQGWASIKYSLVVGLSYKDTTPSSSNQMLLRAIYMPYNVRARRIGTDHRWIQPNYFWDSYSFVDHKWAPIIVADGATATTDSMALKASFLKSLQRLIDSDLHNLPKLIDDENTSDHDHHDESSRHSSDSTVAQLSSHLKTQFQIRANSLQICLLSISKPYFHVGDCITFVVNLRPPGHIHQVGLPVIQGFMVHLEAHELFYPATGTPIKNVYRVSASHKFNTIASTMVSIDPTDGNAACALVSSKLDIERHLPPQFESSRFMGLKYYLVFRFVVGKFPAYTRLAPPMVSASSLPNSEIPSHEISFESFRENNEDLTGSSIVFRLPLPIL